MPVLGIFAVFRSGRHLARLLWRKEAFRGLLSVTFMTILIGTVFFYYYEPTITTWVDAYYFTVITLTTIGYGDMGPTTPLTRIFTTFYAFGGLGIIAGLISIIGESVIEDVNQRAAQKRQSNESTP